MGSDGDHTFTNKTPNYDASGTARSTESGLEQALGRERNDSDEELEAIRGSVRSLRAQRAAVEKLKEKARAGEGEAEVLRRKLAEAENRTQELRAQGGRDVVRRLMDEVHDVTDLLLHSVKIFGKDHSCTCNERSLRVLVCGVQQSTTTAVP